jgi:Tol biopolymer transport system component
MRRISPFIAGAALAVGGLTFHAPAGTAAEDAGRLLFTRQAPNDDLALWVRDADGERVLVDGPLNERRARWSPDGTEVAFSRLGDAETTSDVTVLTADGREVQLGVAGAYDDRPAWSPDGDHIAFLSSRSSDNNSQFGADVFVAELDPGHTRVVRVERVVDMALGIWGVDWSPDGSSLAISGWSDKGGRDIFEVPLSGPFAPGQLRNVTKTPSESEDDPEWSPDGSMISFTEEKGQSQHVGVLNRNGTSRRLVTSGKSLNNSATWSLDGGSLTFGSNRSGKSWDLYRVDIASGALSTVVATDGVGENSADWGPTPVPPVVDGGGGEDPPLLPPLPVG